MRKNRYVISAHHVCITQGTAQRPEVRIVTWKNDELTTDTLPVHGFEHYKAKDYALAHAPFSGFNNFPTCDLQFFSEASAAHSNSLELFVYLYVGSSYAGGQWAEGDEPLYYIVSPKDVVIARPRLVVCCDQATSP